MCLSRFTEITKCLGPGLWDQFLLGWRRTSTPWFTAAVARPFPILGVGFGSSDMSPIVWSAIGTEQQEFLTPPPVGPLTIISV